MKIETRQSRGTFRAKLAKDAKVLGIKAKHFSPLSCLSLGVPGVHSSLRSGCLPAALSSYPSQWRYRAGVGARLFSARTEKIGRFRAKPAKNAKGSGRRSDQSFSASCLNLGVHGVHSSLRSGCLPAALSSYPSQWRYRAGVGARLLSYRNEIKAGFRAKDAKDAKGSDGRLQHSFSRLSLGVLSVLSARFLSLVFSS